MGIIGRFYRDLSIQVGSEDSSIYCRDTGEGTLRHPSANSLSGFNHLEGFALWEQYVEAALGAIGKLDCQNLLTLRFEDLVRSPEPHLRALAEFVGPDPDPKNIRSAAARINPGRGWAFVSNPALREFHRRRNKQPLMKRFAYDRLPPTSSSRSDGKTG